jgi:hypothetical protein
MPMGVDGGSPVVWSKDGKKLAFASDTYPDCADLACVRKRSEEKEKNPVKVYKATRLLFRHWDEWRTDVRKHIYVMDLATKDVKDLTPGDFDSPTVQYEDGAFTFSPDGSLLAFVSNREGIDREAFTTNMDVFLVPVAGGTPENVTRANIGADVAPQFSADGATLAVKSQRRAGFEADRWYVDLYDVKAKKNALPETDISVNDLVFAKQGHLTPSAPHGRPLPRGLTGARRRTSWGGNRLPPRDVGGVIFSKATLPPPGSSCSRAAEARALRTRTRPGRRRSTWVAESLAKGRRGHQYWLVKPPAFDAAKKYRSSSVGGPQWGTAGRPLEPRALGRSGLDRGGSQPRELLGLRAASGRDLAGLGRQVMTDLDGVFDAVVKLPYVDPKRQGIAGASYGVHAVNWLVGTRVDRFKAAVTRRRLQSRVDAQRLRLWFPTGEAGRGRRRVLRSGLRTSTRTR